MIKIEDSDFARDKSSRALINTNVRALQEYKIRKEQAERIARLETDMNEIKTSLKSILDALTNLGTGK